MIIDSLCLLLLMMSMNQLLFILCFVFTHIYILIKCICIYAVVFNKSSYIYASVICAQDYDMFNSIYMLVTIWSCT